MQEIIEMTDIITQLKELRNLSGNAQLDYLEEHKSELMKEILEYTYDPHRKYKIDEGKFKKCSLNVGLFTPQITKKRTFVWEDWYNYTCLLDKFAEKRAVNDNDVRTLKSYILSFIDEDVQNLLVMVLYKDLRLNLGIKKIQTVWPDFCRDMQVQLAEKYTGKNFDNGIYSRKFDGKRMVIDKGTAKSRAGNLCKVEPIKHILSELSNLSTNYVLDGECLYFDENGKEDFQRVISLSSSDNRKPECDNIYYVIFDLINTEQWDNQQCSDSIPFSIEYQSICRLLEVKVSTRFGYSLFETKYPHILVARQDYNPTHLMELCKQNKWEGLMYRNADVPYEFKRTKNLLKIKEMQDGEFELVGLQNGSGKNEDRLGNLFISFRDHAVGVGSGFTDDDRILIWNNKELFHSTPFRVAFDVKVQYFEETVDSSDKPSLRFPVFLCFRHKDTREEYTVQQVIDYCKGE